jgi:hypothetical protein
VRQVGLCLWHKFVKEPASAGVRNFADLLPCFEAYFSQQSLSAATEDGPSDAECAEVGEPGSGATIVGRDLAPRQPSRQNPAEPETGAIRQAGPTHQTFHHRFPACEGVGSLAGHCVMTSPALGLVSRSAQVTAVA